MGGTLDWQKRKQFTLLLFDVDPPGKIIILFGSMSHKGAKLAMLITLKWPQLEQA
jgi:hypothetical protein